MIKTQLQTILKLDLEVKRLQVGLRGTANEKMKLQMDLSLEYGVKYLNVGFPGTTNEENKTTNYKRFWSSNSELNYSTLVLHKLQTEKMKLQTTTNDFESRVQSKISPRWLSKNYKR